MSREERRLVALCALLVAVLLGLAGMLLRGHVAKTLTADSKVQTAFLDLALRDRARYLGETLREERARGKWPENLPDILTRNHADYNRDIFMQVFEADGRLVAASANTPAGVPLSPAARAKWEDPSWTSADVNDPSGRQMRLVTYPVYTGHGTEEGMRVLGFSQAGLRMPQTDVALAQFSRAMGAALAGFWVLFIAALWAAISTASQRHRREAAAMQAAQHRFIGDAAHELGTPLAILRGEIDIALRRERSADDYRSALSSCRQEIERLSRLSENLLALATADAGQKLLHRARCDASTIARAVHARFSRLAAEGEITFTLSTPESLPFLADSLAIEQILGNLVSNALRHTPRGESVLLEAASEAKFVTFRVVDTGEGIPPAHLPLLFDRFHRVDKARSRAGGGAGLGLAIVKTLVEAHGGTVTVQSTVGVGSCFICKFPLLPDGHHTLP